MSFLPEGFENLKPEKPYWKMSQMKEGENRFRIVGRPIAGWLDWKDGKPIRSRPNDKPARPYDPEKPIRPFWVLHVWDYAREALFVLEITQTSIIRSLTQLAQDSDWGDFTGYDLKLKKEGTGKETKYSITPLPHKKLTEKVLKAIANTPINLEALYDGGDPWTDLTKVDKKTGEIISNSNFISADQVQEIEKFSDHFPEFKEKMLKWVQVEKVEEIPAHLMEKVSLAMEKFSKKEGAA